MNSNTPSLLIGDRYVGRNYPCFIIAELSGNHAGSLDNAINLIRLAARSGADAVKLQTYRPDTITLNCTTDDFCITSGPWDKYRTLWDLYSDAYTPEWHTLFNVAWEEPSRYSQVL